jgi:hypothetical protein
MGDCGLYKIECFHVIGTPEFERLKVTALNLFHPTASPPFKKSVSSYYGEVCLSRGGVKSWDCWQFLHSFRR